MIKILAASFLGAVLCVLWSALSWMVLGWHATVMRQFQDESAVAAVLSSNVADELKRHGTTSGVFLMPSDAISGTIPQAPDERMVNAPPSTRPKKAPPSLFTFAIIRTGPRTGGIWISLAYIFARSFVACLILSVMLGWTMRLDYLQRVLFCVLGGVFASIVADVPMLVWFEAPLRYTFINFADHLCEWTFAGLVIAALVEGRGMWEHLR